MKSSLKNMVLVLFCISLIASLCLGLVNMITAEPIAAAKDAAKQEALKQVLPEFDEVKLDSVYKSDNLAIPAYKAIKGGEVIGYAIESASLKGFNGEIKLMVGFDTKGTILNVWILQQKETPGLGTKMAIRDDSVKNPLLKVIGKDASTTKLFVTKDGGDIDALTAATISSRAYLDAVSRAYNVFKVAAGLTDKLDSPTGATSTAKKADAKTAPATDIEATPATAEATPGATKTDGGEESKRGNFEPKKIRRSNYGK